MELGPDEKHSWGVPVTNPRDKAKLKKKYLPNGQLPGALNDYPILISSLNDWFPIHMIPVVPFAMLFDYTLMQDVSKEAAVLRETQDSVEKFREGYKMVLDHIQNIKRLDPIQLRIYKDMWRNYILKNLIYPHDTMFIDFPSPEQHVDPDQLFMFAGFAKPGKHRSLLYDPDEDVWYKRDFYIDEREMDVPMFANFEHVTAEKGAVLNSVLKDWKDDNHTTYIKCLEHDEENWKLGNGAFIKDMSDYHNLRQLILKYMPVLKEIFITTCAQHDQFPCLGNFGTEEFSNSCGLVDNKHVKKDTVNRMFITANYSDKEENDQNPLTALVRYEFIEYLVRMAKFKYKDSVAPNGVQTVTEAFQQLMDQLMLPYYNNHC